MLRSCAVLSVREEERQGALHAPLGLAASEVSVDGDLCRVVEVAELSAEVISLSLAVEDGKGTHLSLPDWQHLRRDIRQTLFEGQRRVL